MGGVGSRVSFWTRQILVAACARGRLCALGQLVVVLSTTTRSGGWPGGGPGGGSWCIVARMRKLPLATVTSPRRVEQLAQLAVLGVLVGFDSFQWWYGLGMVLLMFYQEKPQSGPYWARGQLQQQDRQAKHNGRWRPGHPKGPCPRLGAKDVSM